MREEDGKNKHTTSGSDEGQPESFRFRVGGVQANSRTFGAGQIGITATDNSGRYPDRQHIELREIDLGKILERLDKLEQEFLDYVEAHQGRLGARLSESEAKKTAFIEEAGAIRSEIYALMSQQDCNNENK